jgi:tetratricopeptide (TPR) repeat protein
MNKPQILAIVLCAGLTAGLFYMGMQSSSYNTADRVSAKAGKLPINTSTFDIGTYTKSLKSQLKPEAAASIETIEAKISSARNSDQKATALLMLASAWDTLGSYAMSGLYYEQAAEIKQSDWKTWLYAANRFTNAAGFVESGVEQLFLINKGKRCARMVTSLDAGNIDAENLLAECIIRQSDDSIMTVIPILKGIEKKDSNNIQAIYSLALLSTKSGQLDKAELRFRRLTRLEPLNPENYYQLAEVLSKNGKDKEAVSMLEICRSLVKDKEILSKIESRIKEIKH